MLGYFAFNVGQLHGNARVGAFLGPPTQSARQINAPYMFLVTCGKVTSPIVAVMLTCIISLDSLVLAWLHTSTSESKLYIQHNTKAPINKMRTSRVRYLVPPFADLTRCCAIRCNCTCARIALLTPRSSDTPSSSTYGDKSTHSRSSKAISGFAATDSANTRCVSSFRMAVPLRLYVLRCEDKAAHVSRS
jgi:hypothetical protein